MSVSVWCEMVCGNCSTATEGVFSDRRLPKKKLLNHARRARWIVEKDEVFCSPDCRDQHRKNAGEL